MGVAHHYIASDLEEITGTDRFDRSALDSWFEEDEEVFVHPRNPYTRVDALRSARSVAIEVEGTLLAESSRTVMVFETGLPTRYYFDRLDVRFEHLQPSDTVTSCPYKGMTSSYWSAAADDRVNPDLAWAYDFPTRQLLPIAGLVSFYNEKAMSSSTASVWSGPSPSSHNRAPPAFGPDEQGIRSSPRSIGASMPKGRGPQARTPPSAP